MPHSARHVSFPVPCAVWRRWSCQAAASLALAAPLAVQAQERRRRLLGLGASYVADALHVADGGVARGGGLAARADAW
jgi:porin